MKISIEQPKRLFSADGRMVSVILGFDSLQIFGMARENESDIDVWIHEFNEMSIRHILSKMDYAFITGFNRQKTNPSIIIPWRGDLIIPCCIDHLLAALTTSTILIDDDIIYKFSGNQFWNLLLTKLKSN